MTKQLLTLAGGLFLSATMLAQVILFDPIVTPTGGSAAQDFETAYNIYDTYIADDFVIPAGDDWWIDSIRLYGSYSAGAMTTAGVIISIFENNNGAFGNLIFTDTINSDVDYNGDGWLTPNWVGNPIHLTPGDYWLVGTARKDFDNGGGQWYWTREETLFGEPAMWSNPENGFATTCTSFVPFYQCAALALSDSGAAFRMYGCYGPVKPSGTGIIGNDTTFCSGPAVTLSGVGSGPNLGYIWSNGAVTQDISIDSAGSYSVLVYDTITQCGYVEGPVNINVLPTPQFELQDDTICPEILPYTLFANPPGASVTWYNGATGIVTTADQAGTYWATYTGTNGCIGGDTMTLTVDALEPPTFLPGSEIDLCEGDDVEVSTADMYAGYAWGDANDPGTVIASTPTIIIDEGGTYTLNVTASNGCVSEGELVVIDRPLPTPTFVQNYTATFDVNLTTGENYDTYLWSTGGSGATITVTENGIYSVTVVDQYGCEGSGTINIQNVGVENPLVNAFGFFPNPTKGLVSFTWPEGASASTVVVVDATGRTIMSKSGNRGMDQIDLSSLDNGVYFLRVSNGLEEGIVKLIKQ